MQAPCRLRVDDIRPVVVGNVGDNSSVSSSYRLYASETQQLADATPICYLWSCYGAAVNQRRADLLHTLATPQLRDRYVIYVI